LRMLHEARASGIPVVEIWDHPSTRDDPNGFAHIGFDHFEAGRAMARHLLDKGHSDIAYVDSGVAEDFRVHERGEGFLAEATGRGARAEILRADVGDAFDAGRAALLNLRSRTSSRVTAVAFSNDHLASGALLEASRQNIRVPTDLALLGFGDFPLSRQLTPALSTLRPPTEEIGLMAAQAVLLSLTEGPEPVSSHIPFQLIAREST